MNFGLLLKDEERLNEGNFEIWYEKIYITPKSEKLLYFIESDNVAKFKLENHAGNDLIKQLEKI